MLRRRRRRLVVFAARENAGLRRKSKVGGLMFQKGVSAAESGLSQKMSQKLGK